MSANLDFKFLAEKMETRHGPSEVDEMVVASFLRAYDAASLSPEMPLLTTDAIGFSNSPTPPITSAEFHPTSNETAIARMPMPPLIPQPLDLFLESGAVGSNFGSLIDADRQSFFLPPSVPRPLYFSDQPPRGEGSGWLNDLFVPLSSIDLQLPIETPKFEYYDPSTYYYGHVQSVNMDSMEELPDHGTADENAMPVSVVISARSHRRSGGLILKREILISCKRCRVKIGAAHLSGTSDKFMKPFVCDFVCCECRAFADQPTAPPMRPTARNKSAKSDELPKAECCVCKVRVGNGGVRLVVDSQSHNPAAWQLPEFSVEYMCESCHRQFKFCAPCSNGTAGTRTGRFRPRQMFIDGGGTCFLPHGRLGNYPDMIFVSYRLPMAADATPMPDLMNYIYAGNFMLGEKVPYSEHTQIATTHMAEDVASHVLRFTYYFFDGATMQDYANNCTWELLQACATDLAKEVTRFIRGLPSLRPFPTGTQMRRYIGIAFYPKYEAKATREDPQNQKFSFKTNHAGIYQIGGTALATWNIDARTFISDRITFFGSTNPVLNKVFRALIHINRQRVEKEAAAENLPLPLHYCSSLARMHRKAHVAKLLQSMLLIGFQSLDTYCAMHGLDREEMRRACDSGDVSRLEEIHETFVRPWDQ